MNQSEHVLPPMRGYTITHDTSTTQKSQDLWIEVTRIDGIKDTRYYCGRFLTLQAITADLYYCFSAAAHGTDTVTTTIANGLDADGPVLIPAGEERSFFVPAADKFRYLQLLGGAAGTCRLWASSRKEDGSI